MSPIHCARARTKAVGVWTRDIPGSQPALWLPELKACAHRQHFGTGICPPPSPLCRLPVLTLLNSSPRPRPHAGTGCKSSPQQKCGAGREEACQSLSAPGVGRGAGHVYLPLGALWCPVCRGQRSSVSCPPTPHTVQRPCGLCPLGHGGINEKRQDCWPAAPARESDWPGAVSLIKGGEQVSWSKVSPLAVAVASCYYLGLNQSQPGQSSLRPGQEAGGRG